jgi:hypothetical protein
LIPWAALSFRRPHEFYTILAIENGWDLDWSQPNVIAAYAKRGRAIQVGNQTGPIKVAEAIEVQPR